MTHGRAQFLCGSVFGLAVGFAVGHLAVGERPRPSWTSLEATEATLPQAQAEASRQYVMTEMVQDDCLSRFPADDVDAPRISPALITADAFRATDDSPASSGEPKPLPATDASPINRQAEEQAASLDILLRAELQHSSPQEREIWDSALDGVAPTDAAEILKLWKSMANPDSAGQLAIVPDPVPGPIASSVSEKDSDSAPVPVSSLTGQAISQGLIPPELQRNLLNTATPGFRQVIPEFRYDLSEGGRGRSAIAGYRLDLRPGPITVTHDPYHVAIDGAGYFQVIGPAGEALLTRCGNLAIDSERRLCIQSAGVKARLADDIEISVDAVSLEISQDGTVRVHLKAAEAYVAKIHLCRVHNPAALVPAEGAYLRPTEFSGQPVRECGPACTPSKLLQHSQEGSNVRSKADVGTHKLSDASF